LCYPKIDGWLRRATEKGDAVSTQNMVRLAVQRSAVEPPIGLNAFSMNFVGLVKILVAVSVTIK
jgi:hypothetical protein